jgi:S1-C subfamily serine protease
MIPQSLLRALVMALAVCCSAQSASAREPGVARQIAPRGELLPDERATIEVFRRASVSVVHITTLVRQINFWTRNVREVPRGNGSGFFWDEHGHVVTNHHVIAGAQSAQVRLIDQRSFPARLVGASPEHDLAVLRIEVPKDRLAPIPLGSSADLQVGQKVLAIGNPFGLDHSLTTGIISALDRSIDGEEGRAIHHLIQTDAAINPGNSGGPLLDSAGRLIGVNTAIYSPSGGSAGIGFAVPADTVNRVVPDLIRHGRYLRPSLGIVVDQDISRAITAAMGVKGLVLLAIEPGSAAAKAGLRAAQVARDGGIKPGDILLAVDGEAVDAVDTLTRLLDQRRIGGRVTLRLLREGAVIELPLVLEAPRAVR